MGALVLTSLPAIAQAAIVLCRFVGDRSSRLSDKRLPIYTMVLVIRYVQRDPENISSPAKPTFAECQGAKRDIT